MDSTRREELHPLKNHLILEHILRQLPLTDLKQCRLVCRPWRVTGDKVMRQLAKVKISLEVKANGVESFMQLIQSDQSEFSLSPFSDTFQLCYAKMENEFDSFWEICGKHIKHLNLLCVTFPTADALRTAIFASCPNLTKLELCSVRVRNDLIIKGTTWKEPLFPPNHNVKSLHIYGSLLYFMSAVSLVETFVQFPALEDLYTDCHAAHHKMDNIFRSLTSVRNHDRNLAKIKRLRCSFYELDDHSILLSSIDQGIALETLEAKWMRNENDMMTVNKIWTANSTSLKNVYLRGVRTRSPDTPIRIPFKRDLSKLEDFVLVSWKLDSVRFLEHLPNLKKLCLYLDELKDSKNMDGISLPNCTQFTLSIKNQLIREEVFKKFQTMMPNIEKLQIFHSHNATFELICEFWPKLKSLDLIASEVNDAGICGWDEDDVNVVNENQNTSSRPVTVPRPNLANLKYLQNFRYDRHVKSFPLGYCAAVYGVMLLPEIRNLSAPSHSASGAVWDRLRLQLLPKDEFRPLFDDWI